MTAKEMLTEVKSYVSASGYTWDAGLIENFFLGLKCKGFVLLAGNSDVDKHLLPQLFAEAVGADANSGRWKALTVRPDWLAASDLFGRVNLEGKFLPGAIIDFVKAAQLNPEKPYFLCLEEINLSSVEYYLADVVRGLECRTKPEKKPIFTEKYYGADTDAVRKYGTICIPDNLYVIGTVNMDEASYPLNQRFLDRVHTMELTNQSLMQDTSKSEPHAADVCNNLFLPQYTELVREGEHWDFVLKYFAQFQQINAILTKARAYVEYTLRDDVILYLLHNLQEDLLSEEQAMDFAIIQKVLPRVQGSGKAVGTALSLLLEYCRDRYPNTVKKLQMMLKQIEQDDFAALWV